ncbi:hypothetical protein, partial [uncultured Bacteroides sp.]|uniref:hypothetical protein n=1 Tax=uncultured Bacteroides sp. TaxID=162156 RepID=UPI0027D93CBC
MEHERVTSETPTCYARDTNVFRLFDLNVFRLKTKNISISDGTHKKEQPDFHCMETGLPNCIDIYCCPIKIYLSHKNKADFI